MNDATQPPQKRTRPSQITMERGRAPQGRKSLLINPRIFCRLREALTAGNTYENACRMAGISRTTFYRWREESEVAPEGHQLREFRDMVEKACAEAEHRNVMMIQEAAARHWQASAWWLERRHRGHYGRRKAVALGDDAETSADAAKQTLGVPPEEMTLPQLAAILKRRAPHLAVR